MAQKHHNHKDIMLYSSVILGFFLVSLNQQVSASELTAPTAQQPILPLATSETQPSAAIAANDKAAVEAASTGTVSTSETPAITTNTSTAPSEAIAPISTANTQTMSPEPPLPLVASKSNPTPTNKTTTNYDQLLNDWNSTVAGNDVYDKTNPHMASFNQKLEETVDKHLATYNASNNRTFLWQDKGDYKVSANITATYRKLEDIAKQVTNPSSKHFQDAATITLVKDSMEFLYQNVYNEKTRYRQEKGNASINWWDYEIGTPRAINNTLSLMRPYFTQDDIIKYTQAIESLVPDPTAFRVTSTNPDFPTFKATVANMTDMGRVKLIAGLLRKDDKEIADTIKSIEAAFTFVTKGNGFYKDGSLIDHAVTNPKSPLYNKGVAYNGSYGNVLMDGLSQLIPIIQKTNSPMSNDKMEIIYHWVNEAFLPLMVHGELMDMTRGRSISRVSSESHVAAVEALRAILRIADMASEPQKTAIKTQVKAIVTEGNAFYNVYDNLKTYRDIQLMKNLLEDSNIPVVKRSSYVKTYNSMDKLAAYNTRKDYGIGLSMFSSKTQNFEAMNNENLRGWHTGDGMFYLYNGDLGHYSKHYWATVNPYKLPGTTETNVMRPDATAANIKKQPNLVGMGVLPDDAFVASKKINDTTALAAMTFTNFNKTLTLNKGWFILDGKIVFVGNSIQNTSSDKVATTIEQRKEDKDHPYTTYINGKLANLTEIAQTYTTTRSVFLESNDPDRNIGYVFLKPATITAMKAIQTGKWSDIKGDDKSPAATTKVSNTFITISQPHQGNGDSYAYALIPNISRQAFEQLVANFDLKLLQNDNKASLIFDATSRRLLSIHFSDKRFDSQVLPQDKQDKRPETSKPVPKQAQTNSGTRLIKAEVETSPLPLISENKATVQPLNKPKSLPKTGEANSILSLMGMISLISVASSKLRKFF